MTTNTPTSARRAAAAPLPPPNTRRDPHGALRAAMSVRIRPAAYALAGALVAGSRLLDVLVAGWTR